jgi:hypothetical protein
MKFRCFTKRSLLILCVLVLLYAGLWLLTSQVGAPKVRSVVVAAMRVPPNYTDVSQTNRMVRGPKYWCNTHACAPFLVRVDSGLNPGHMDGAWDETLYLWFFGHTSRMREIYSGNN